MSIRSNQVILNKVMDIRKSDSEEKIRLELYSVVSYMILSTDIFPNNIDIKNFLENKDKVFKEFKPYLYLSRTILLGRVIKTINVQEKRFLYNFSLDLKEKLLNELESTENKSDKIKITKEKNPNNPNYTDSLFNRFKREE